MMNRFAPPNENDTTKYKKFLHKKIGVEGSRKIKDLTDKEFERLWQAIEQFEGYKEGTVAEVYKITQVRKNKKGNIYSYFTDFNQWITKERCIELAKLGKLELEICLSKLSMPYLRAKPNSLFQGCLNHLVERVKKLKKKK